MESLLGCDLHRKYGSSKDAVSLQPGQLNRGGRPLVISIYERGIPYSWKTGAETKQLQMKQRATIPGTIHAKKVITFMGWCTNATNRVYRNMPNEDLTLCKWGEAIQEPTQ